MQCMAQPLVLDDRADVDLAEPVVALVAEALAVGSDLDVAVGVFVDVDVTVDEREVADVLRTGETEPAPLARFTESSFGNSAVR